MITARKRFEIGDWTVDPVHNEITKNDRKEAIEQKAMEVLLYLARHNGNAVSRQELLDAIWTDTYVSEESLTRCISILRKAFGDDPGNPTYIKTIRNKGYQLIASVKEPTLSAKAPGGPEKVFRSTWFRVWGIAVLLVLLGLLPTILVNDGDLPGSSVLWTQKPLTFQKGIETDPAVSPDGSRLAYAAKNSDSVTWDIYIQITGAGDPFRLTNSKFDNRAPEWSPDGRFVAFVRKYKNGSSIYIVPAMGGSQRKLIDRNITGFPYLSWSPDGRWIAYSDRPKPEASNALFLVNTKTGETQQITQTSEQHWGDFSPSFSKDGQRISFITSISAGTQAIYELDLSDRSVSRTTPGYARITYQRWSGSDGNIYFTTDTPVSHAIWKVTQAHPFKSRWTGLSGASFSTRNGQFIISKGIQNLDLWSYSIKHKQFNQHAWDGINSSGSEYAPVLSPDGKFIAFLSDRTGHPELWVYDTSNSKLTQLTNFEGSLDIRAPAWHPSGKSLVFNVFSPETHADIYTVDITGTPPEPLIANPSNEREPDWSRDGKSLLFGSDQTGKWQIWKYHPKENRRVQHTTDGGYKARFASKNTEFYFTKYDQTGIWRYHSDGTEERIINAPLGAMHNTWAIGKNGIYYELLESGSLFPELYFYDFNQRKIQNIATLKGLKIVKDIAVLSQKNQIIISGARESESGIFLFSRKERKKPQL